MPPRVVTRSSERPAGVPSSLQSTVPSLSASAALKRSSTTLRNSGLFSWISAVPDFLAVARSMVPWLSGSMSSNSEHPVPVVWAEAVNSATMDQTMTSAVRYVGLSSAIAISRLEGGVPELIICFGPDKPDAVTGKRPTRAGAPFRLLEDLG